MEANETIHIELVMSCEKKEPPTVEVMEQTLPREGDEIVITDYIAKCLGASIGSKLEYRDLEFSVVGIIETDYVKYDLQRKLLVETDSEYLNYLYQYYYNVAVVNEKCLKRIQDNTKAIYLQYSNFSLGQREFSYLESDDYIEYSVANQAVANYLVSGRMPKEENEVLVSESFLQQYNQAEEGNFVDIRQDKYNGYYEDTVNLYDLFPKGITVVGVFSEEYDEDSQVLVKKTMFDKLSDAYFSNFCDGYSIEINDNQYKAIIGILERNNMTLEEPAALRIYSFSDALDGIKQILYVLLVIVFVLAILMVTNYISVSIHDNHKNIGILRALGVRTKDVLAIFMYETMFVYSMSAVCSIAGIKIFLWYINTLFQSELSERTYEIMLLGIANTLLVYLVIFISCITVVLVPIKRLAQKKPIEVIRNS